MNGGILYGGGHLERLHRTQNVVIIIVFAENCKKKHKKTWKIQACRKKKSARSIWCL